MAKMPGVMFGHGFVSEAKYSKEAQKVISKKMRKMEGENKPKKQKIAIALSTARQKGLKVPDKK